VSAVCRSSDDPEAVNAVIGAGGDPNEVDEHGWTPLHSTAAYGYRRSADALLAAGADPELKSVDGLTAADIARANFHDELGELLSRRAE